MGPPYCCTVSVQQCDEQRQNNAENIPLKEFSYYHVCLTDNIVF